MVKKTANLNPPNYLLLGLTLTLVFFGIIAIASASILPSWRHYDNTYYYLVHQLIFGVLPGLLLMTIVSRFDYHVWQKLAPVVLLGTLVLLIAIFTPLGIEAGGAQRWIDIGFTSIQPSEFAKLAIVIYLAAWFDRKKNELDNFKNGFLPSLITLGVIIALIYKQPDMGTLIVVAGTAGVMFFTAGTKLRFLLGTASIGIAGLLLAIQSAPYRAARIITFLDPSHDPQGLGYHVNQALLAIGSGGWFGYGYNRSLQKHNYLPEPMGDSIFAIIAEEMGFVRTAIVILAFLLFALVAYRIANKAPDNFGKLLAIGIGSWIALQAFINIGAMVGLLPLTGIPLPFISYGSSSLLALLIGAGILLNISRQTA